MPSRRRILLLYAMIAWSLTPYLAITSVYVEGLHTAYLVGHLPVPMVTNPPPNPLHSFLNEASQGSVIVLLFSLLALPIALVASFARNKHDKARVSTIVYALGWALVIFLLHADPGGIIAWWLD